MAIISNVSAPQFPTGLEMGEKPVSRTSAFADRMSEAIQKVDQAQHVADDKLAGLASGQEADLHGVMIALEEADITLRAMVTVRDKVIDAYKEIMNMAI